ncbi:MAG: pyridoxine 5'-phosphate synthase [Verrucomicrobiota bacterium]
MPKKLKLGVNIDHVATLRQARYSTMQDTHNVEPSLLDAAKVCIDAGADSITMHLREDRRHIQDADVFRVRKELPAPLNLEMGNTPEIVDIGIEIQPDFVCLVPENRQEVTTEGGLDVVGNATDLKRTIDRLQGNGAAVSLFIDPDPEQVAKSAELGAKMVELHTGAFANGALEGCPEELKRLIVAAEQAHQAGLQVNAGHGINLTNLPTLFQIPFLAELNVGHHLISRAVFVGLKQSVEDMLDLMSGYEPGI